MMVIGLVYGTHYPTGFFDSREAQAERPRNRLGAATISFHLVGSKLLHVC